MNIRKTVVIRETVFSEAGSRVSTPINRVAGVGVIMNPFASRFEKDLSALFDVGFSLGERLMQEIMPLLSNPVVSYGKAAIVGAAGDLEHGHALLHPKLGKPVRGAIGGGEALIPSSAKLAAIGSTIDVPLGHKDNAWSFDHFDAMTVSVPDAPRSDEIMMVVVIADGGRPNARVGQTRAIV
ncbi:MAG: amino acid synthesis family protein [Gammaproteobacteria bacterium]|nr:amino acid synthesis family protein [Gammaproteobacteria bacterium]